MKTTTFYKGHRWSTEELKTLMQLWDADTPLEEISSELKSTNSAVLKMVQKLRKNGIPLKRRHKGNSAGRSRKSWTNEEVSYLLRRRGEKATVDQIANELGRTWNGVNGMIATLRRENVPVPMYGQGVKRLWDANELRALALQMPNVDALESDIITIK